MSTPAVLNLSVNELGKKFQSEALPISPNEFYKFNNTRARMQDSIYLMTQKSHLNSPFPHQNIRCPPLENGTSYGRQPIT